MGVGEVHDVFGSCLHLIDQLLIDQTLVPLGKENGRLDIISLEFETGNLLISEISL